MDETAIEREKKRQRIARKKKRRQQMMIRRMLLLVVVFLIMLLLIKGISGRIAHKQNKQSVETTSDQVEVAQQVDEKAGSKISDSGENEKGIELVTKDELQKGNLILVNEACPLRKYDDLELVKIADNNEGLYSIKSNELLLQKEALEAFNQMVKDFTAQNEENDLGIISGYRDYEMQERLHYDSVNKKVNEDTDIFVAKPDRSEHHTGLAIDMGLYYKDGSSSEYDGTGIYSWINENCYHYGFIVRYEEAKKNETGIGNEPWHIRYVGVPHAENMKNLNLCLEEYITFLKNYRYYTNPFQGEKDAANYSIYYVPAAGEITKIPVPETKAYSISGNNLDGFIVTVNLTANKSANKKQALHEKDKTKTDEES